MFTFLFEARHNAFLSLLQQNIFLLKVFPLVFPGTSSTCPLSQFFLKWLMTDHWVGASACCKKVCDKKQQLYSVFWNLKCWKVTLEKFLYQESGFQRIFFWRHAAPSLLSQTLWETVKSRRFFIVFWAEILSFGEISKAQKTSLGRQTCRDTAEHCKQALWTTRNKLKINFLRMSHRLMRQVLINRCRRNWIRSWGTECLFPKLSHFIHYWIWRVFRNALHEKKDSCFPAEFCKRVLSILFL